ncbi:MAG: Transcriptional regulator, MerR family [Pseudonocardiales bacterium]|nr:Transcriptional regulator, MerR family [Pseudonocardiales bacterium]
MDDQLLTITEVAALLRVPVATLRYWRHLGAGPRGFRLGRRVVYRHSDVTDWINLQHERDARGESA